MLKVTARQDLSIRCLLDFEETFHDWFISSTDRRLAVLVLNLALLCFSSRFNQEALFVQAVAFRWTKLPKANIIIAKLLLLLTEAELGFFDSRSMSLKRTVDELALILENHWVVQS